MLSLSHENAIQFMGVAKQNNRWYIIMEHLVSENLRKISTISLADLNTV